MAKAFEYSNLVGRPSGPFVKVGKVLLPGIRKVQKQIVPYAEAWQQHNQQAMNGDGPIWVVLGDSMAQGIGARHPKQGWVGQLDELLKANNRHYRIINLSMSGARISDVLRTQLPAMRSLTNDPDLVTVMIGSNDLVRRKYRAKALPDFDDLVEQVPEGSVVANLLGNRPVPAAMDMRLQRAVNDRNLKLADIRGSGPNSWRGMVAEDHFHPNEAGYAIIARVFASALGLGMLE
jgi:lysophospholipase L1-like esterase